MRKHESSKWNVKKAEKRCINWNEVRRCKLHENIHSYDGM